MNCLELFAGAGGAALGIEAAGLEHVGLVEMNADACATLEQAGLGRIIQADVRDLDAIEAQAFEFRRVDIDLMWASFPCQCFSIAGSRLGADDERNGWPWTIAAIDRFKPKAFIGENVRGLLSFDYFEDTILADLRKRYKHVGYWLLNAADFGVPQTRRRVFIYGIDRPPVPPTCTHGPGMFTKPYVTMGDALQINGKRVIGGGTNPRTAGEASTRSYRDLTDEPSTTVAAVQIGNAGPWVLDKSDLLVGNLRGREGGARMETHSLGEPSRTIRHGGGSSVPYLLQRPSPCVMANEVKGHTNPDVDRGRRTAVGRAADALYLATGRRRLTVQECATLQGFPPDYPFVGTKRSQYTQVGNAVPPRLAEVVVRAVLSL